MIRRYNPITTTKKHHIESSIDAQLAPIKEAKTALIIGTDPAGLATAYELLRRTTIIPILLDETGVVGGNAESPHINNANDKNKEKKLALNHRFKSSIYFNHKFFNLPLKLSFDTFKKLGIGKTIVILASYLKTQLLSKKEEQNLEGVLIKQFGYVFYDFLLKDYFEKIYGVPCNKLTGNIDLSSVFNDISLTESAIHKDGLLDQTNDLEEHPNLLWNEVVRRIKMMGGKILLNSKVIKVHSLDENIISSLSIDDITGRSRLLSADYFISSTPINRPIENSNDSFLSKKNNRKLHVCHDAITVWVLVRQLSFKDAKTGEWKALNLEDDYIYIHDKGFKVGRLQLSNNRNHYIAHENKNIWVGMDFICPDGDWFWNMEDQMISQLAINELTNLGFIAKDNVLYTKIYRIEKAFYISDGSCDKLFDVKKYQTGYKNFFLVENKINNSYSYPVNAIIAAISTVDNICNGSNENQNIWEKIIQSIN